MALFDSPFSLEIPVQIGYLRAVFFINENLYVLSKECTSVPHNHHDFELRYVAEGKCNQNISNEIYDAEKGDLLIVHPLEYHCQRQTHITDSASQYNLRFTVEIPNDKASPAEQRAYQTAIKLLSDIRRVHNKSGVIHLYFQRLTEEIYNKIGGYVCNMQSLCALILNEVLRLSGADIRALYPPQELKYRAYSRSAIDSFFTHKYLTDVKIEDLAADMKISRRQVNRIISKMFGMSFTQKLVEMRLNQAKLQLTYTDKPISVICHDSGFQNYSYFISCFKKAYQMTPSEYRIKAQKKK